MILEAQKVGSSLIVSLSGELDLETSPAFRELVEEKLNHYESIKHLILDLNKVSFIDSSGLGVILGQYKRLSQRGGRLSAINVSQTIQRILGLSGLLKIIRVYRDRQQALDS
ncbi:MAG: anti-sigma F factor antagonist [Bacillota bacterium]